MNDLEKIKAAVDAGWTISVNFKNDAGCYSLFYKISKYDESFEGVLRSVDFTLPGSLDILADEIGQKIEREKMFA